jgi:hypothetical protein
MHLQHTQGGGFIEHSQPAGGIKLGCSTLEGERVRTIRALQRAAVGQLDKQAHGRRGNMFYTHTGPRIEAGRRVLVKNSVRSSQDNSYFFASAQA